MAETSDRREKDVHELTLEEIFMLDEPQPPLKPMYPDSDDRLNPPSCLTFNWEDLMNVAIMGGDPAMLPQPEHIIDAMQAELDKAEARGDDITAEFFANTLRLLEECAMLSQEQIDRHGDIYHYGLKTWPEAYKYDIPTDYDEWAEMNRRKQRQAKETQNHE